MDTIIRELSESQIDQIRQATEDIVENVGFKVGHEGLRRRCRKAGAKVDEATETVRLPAELLGELLSQVPSAFTMADLDGNERVIGGPDNNHYHAIVTDPWIIDYETQKPRRPTLSDIRRHTIVAQKLSQVAFISLMDFPVTDVEGPTSNLRAMQEHLLHHNKHVLAMPSSSASFQRWLRIDEIRAQGRELGNSRLMSVAVAVISPLVLSELNSELLMGACNHNLAVFPTVCPVAGSTSPYSLAATMLLGNVEVVFLAALAQIIKPGAPCIYGFGASVADMRSVEALYYSLNTIPWSIASVQLGRSYGMPVGVGCGGAMTYRYDLQTGAEGILHMLVAHSLAPDFLTGIGSGYNAIGMSGELMIIHTIWQEVVAFLSGGINTEDVRLGAESIKRVGAGSHFLADDLTMELLRAGQFFASEFLDYSGGAGEEPSLLERAHARLEEMVVDFESPVPEQIQEDLGRFFEVECGELGATSGATY